MPNFPFLVQRNQIFRRCLVARQAA